jgi:hypothetical protein
LEADVSRQGKFGRALVDNLSDIAGDLFCFKPGGQAEKDNADGHDGKQAGQSFCNGPIFHNVSILSVDVLWG